MKTIYIYEPQWANRDSVARKLPASRRSGKMKMTLTEDIQRLRDSHTSGPVIIKTIWEV